MDNTSKFVSEKSYHSAELECRSSKPGLAIAYLCGHEQMTVCLGLIITAAENGNKELLYCLTIFLEG